MIAASISRRLRQEPRPMAYEIQQLLRMTQSQLDELFTASPVGGHSRRRRQGHRNHRRRIEPHPGDCRLHQSFCLAGQDFRREGRVSQEQDPAVRHRRHRRSRLQGRELVRPQGMHRARLLGDLAGGRLDPRRDPDDRAEASISARYSAAEPACFISRCSSDPAADRAMPSRAPLAGRVRYR